MERDERERGVMKMEKSKRGALLADCTVNNLQMNK